MTISNKSETLILIVEDSPTQAKELELLLRRRGFRVDVAANGREGIAAARKARPDIIISDIMMPVMNGYEMCREIKQDPLLRDIPVILLTTLTDPADIIEALHVNADCYVSKPYDGDHLLAKIGALLSTPVRRETEGAESDPEITFAGKRCSITSSRAQILTLLLSIYEDTVMKNRELIKTKEALEDANYELEQKLYELRTSEYRFKSLVMTVPDIVYRLDPDGKFIFLNDAIRKLGYEPAELMGKHFSQVMLPADFEEVGRVYVLTRYEGKITGDKDAPKLFDERRTGNRKTTGLEVRLLPKKGGKTEPGYVEMIGGQVLAVEVNSAGMYDVGTGAKGMSYIGTVGVIRDITERKLMEEALRKSYEELEIKVLNRTADLREVNKSLQFQVTERERVEKELQKLLDDLKQSQSALIEAEKIAAMGTLTAGIAHELNNPMMGIMNFIEYCIKKTSWEDARYGVLKDAERETKRCIEIVQNLLTFSRMKKEGEEALQEEDLALILDRILRLLSYRIEKENVAVDRQVAESVPSVPMVVGNIQQVFLNIISNALDAVRESREKEIHITTQYDSEFVTVKIEDTGCGIPAEILPKIFDPFFTTKPVGQGTGLGLSICRSLVDAHGGEITVMSKIGTGTTFSVSLPIKERSRGNG